MIKKKVKVSVILNLFGNLFPGKCMDVRSRSGQHEDVVALCIHIHVQTRSSSEYHMKVSLTDWVVAIMASGYLVACS